MHWIYPERLPETRGTVTQFLMNEEGKLDGMILDDVRQVQFPPYLSASVAAHVPLGFAVRVRGVKLHTAGIVCAVAIETEGGRTIADEGPEHYRDHHNEQDVERVRVDMVGTVVLQLLGPWGELRGALLGGGTSLRIAPRAAEEIASYLVPGTRVRASGELITSRLASTLDVDTIALANSTDNGYASAGEKAGLGITACPTCGRG